ncbi:MAG: hypothetical protein H7Y38_05635 [Armatimonadetes bacterium]|nr:hypothetical protein [Armatimonadota bacterium]
MNRRDFACRVLLLTTGATAFVAGCEKREERAKIAPPPLPADTPSPEATGTPIAVETPAAPETPAPPVDTEPQAPYGELSGGQEARLSAVMETLAGINANEAKRWTENLSYDATGSERELRVWESIAQGFTSYTQSNPGINDAAKQEAFNVLLTASLVPPAQLLRYVKVSALSAQEAKAVAALYTAPSGSASPTS